MTKLMIILFRARDDDPGLQEAEAGFIRLLDKMTNGSKVRQEGGGDLTTLTNSLLSPAG